MKLTGYELEQRYNEMLDECYEPIKICSYEYAPSVALLRVDPIAYSVGLSDWIDSQLGETIFESNDNYYDEPIETTNEGNN